MLISITPDAPATALAQVLQLAEQVGCAAHLGLDSEGCRTVAIVALGTTAPSAAELAEQLPVGVRPVEHPEAVLTSRAFQADDSVLRMGEAMFGGDTVSIIAGPCAVETEDGLASTIAGLADAGVGIVRGGVFKPRTSPYAFRGHGLDGLRTLAEAAQVRGLPVVTEVLDPRHVEHVAQLADVLQIGTRNMSNAVLIEAAAATRRPILLKRGMAATIDETLLAAEGALAAGAGTVVICERGIRSFDSSTRNVLDVAAIAELKRRTHLPVIADPSHATGRRHLVIPTALAALAAGADGLVVEVHHDPATALVDGEQSLTLPGYAHLVARAELLLTSLGRTLAMKRGSVRTRVGVVA